jgi:hypothetical protein
MSPCHPLTTTSLSTDRDIQSPVPPPRHPPLHLHEHIRPLNDARVHRQEQGWVCHSSFLHRLSLPFDFTGSASTTDKSFATPQLHERVMEIGADRGAAESVDQYLLCLYGGEFPLYFTFLRLVYQSGCLFEI